MHRHTLSLTHTHTHTHTHRGTHDWNKFIMPEELYLMTKQAGLQLAHAAGIALSPLTRRFELTSDLGVNYIAAFHKPAQQQA